MQQRPIIRLETEREKVFRETLDQNDRWPRLTKDMYTIVLNQ